MRTSQAAYKLIEAEEVGSEARYKKLYQRPVWPKYASGATVGIGYDLGQTPAATIRGDWKGRVPDAMLEAMVSASGHTSEAGRVKTAQIRDKVRIPWETALAVHKERVIPRWEARVLKIMPNTALLHGDSFGALMSLTFNRGTGVYTNKDDRYKEGRAIRALIAAKRFDEVPAQIRSMKRLWKGAPLVPRREKEARMFEQGLKKGIGVDDVADDAADVAETKLARVEVRAMQEQLKSMGYHEVGQADGYIGSRTFAAVAAFMRDRDMSGRVAVNRSTLVAIDKAEEEGWQRPIAKERSEASEHTVSKEIETVDRADDAAKASGTNKAMAILISIGGSITAFFKGIVDNFEAALESPTYMAMKEFFYDNMVVLALLVVGVAAMIWYKANQAEKNAIKAKDATVEAFREGRLT